jgi:predicted lysophospholipase L1 biosynthesis ABC-type transport system permease subunit
VDDAPEGARRITVVGVVADVRHEGLDLPPAPDLDLPVGQVIPAIAPWLANNQFWSLRTSGDPARLGEAVRAGVRGIDPDVAVGSLRTQGEIVSEVSALRRLSLLLALLFAGASLLLSALGLYGVVAAGVRQRRKEIGIRIALGARGTQVTRIVASEGLRLAGIGLLAGLLGALASARLLAGLLYGVRPQDPATLAAVALTLAASAGLACWLPARAASRIPPAEALRND